MYFIWKYGWIRPIRFEHPFLHAAVISTVSVILMHFMSVSIQQNVGYYEKTMF